MTFLRWLLGLDGDLLSRPGELSVEFDPRWPGVDLVGAATWNGLLFLLGCALVWWAYRREGKPGPGRWVLAGLRLALIALVLVLLNRPNLTLTQTRSEPSVLAVLVDDSLSMRVKDAPQNATRLAAAQALLNPALLDALAKQHELVFYRFSDRATELARVAERGPDAPPATQPAALPPGVAQLQPTGGQSRPVDALRAVSNELRGRRVAGALVLTDGRATAAGGTDATATQDELKSAFARPVVSVPLGGRAPPGNVEIAAVAVEDVTFAGDIVNVKIDVRASGLAAGQSVKIALRDAAGLPVLTDGKPAEATYVVGPDGGGQVELQFVPDQPGERELVVVAEPPEGTIDVEPDDDRRTVRVNVLDSAINVLYVEGYPRWEYRYLRQELIRDKTTNVSCLLTSADTAFAQEGDRPIRRFPLTPEEIAPFDVVLLGDVDPRQLTDPQLQLVADFVARSGGGLGVLAGPQFAPQAWRGTALEQVLPVDVTRVSPSWGGGDNLAVGWRPSVTPAGLDTGIFRFFLDGAENARYLRESLQLLFWYARGATAKQGVGEVLAQHPTDSGPDGRPAPLLVAGRYGAGRTLFFGSDESWRWRYYTGEDVFNRYWVQALRYLARGRKLGQRQLTLAVDRPTYRLGEQARATVRVLDPNLLGGGLGDRLEATLLDARGQPVRAVALQRQGPDAFGGSFPADQLGQLTLRLPSPIAGGAELRVPVGVSVPSLEFDNPAADRAFLGQLAAATGGQVVEPENAQAQLPEILKSERRVIPVVASRALWDAPIALTLFVALIVAEWVLRKRRGLV